MAQFFENFLSFYGSFFLLPSIFSKNFNFLSKIGEELSMFMKKLEILTFFTLLKTQKLSYFSLGFLRSLRNSQFFRQKCLSFFYAQFFRELSFLETSKKAWFKGLTALANKPPNMQIFAPSKFGTNPSTDLKVMAKKF